jgi:hypothetical protein
VLAARPARAINLRAIISSNLLPESISGFLSPEPCDVSRIGYNKGRAAMMPPREGEMSDFPANKENFDVALKGLLFAFVNAGGDPNIAAESLGEMLLELSEVFQTSEEPIMYYVGTPAEA